MSRGSKKEKEKRRFGDTREYKKSEAGLDDNMKQRRGVSRVSIFVTARGKKFEAGRWNFSLGWMRSERK